MSLEKFVTVWLPILCAVGALIGWLLTHLEKKAKKKEEARIWALKIDSEIKALQKKNRELAEDLEDVRKDFAQFVQQLLFKTK